MIAGSRNIARLMAARRVAVVALDALIKVSA